MSRPLFEAGSGGVVRHLPKFGSWLAGGAGLLPLLVLLLVLRVPPSASEERPCVRSEVGCICFV